MSITFENRGNDRYSGGTERKKKLKKTSYVLSAAAIAFGAFVGFTNMTDVPAASAACAYPSQLLDLTNWKQTLPTGSQGSPTEILQTKLATYMIDPYFKINSSCTAVHFRAPVNGVTTSGSGYPRSELREMINGGTTKASWSTTSGTHTMMIDQAITAVPKAKKHVVAGQIHDASDDVIVIRLEYPKLFVDINGTTGPILDSNYTLGKRFNVKFVSNNGQIKVYYNGGSSPAYTLSKSGSGMYFKAGAYTQSNCSKETDCSSSNYGEVAIYNLLVSHQSSNADVTQPSVSVSSPSNGATVSGTVTLGATASDNVGVAGVKFKVDGTFVGSEDTSSPYGISWDSKTVANGTHTVSAVARDAAGNTSSSTVTVTVNNPVTTSTPVPTPAPAPTTTSTVSGLSFEAESGTVTSPMQIVSSTSASNGKYVVQTTDSGTGAVKYTVNIPSPGSYKLRAKVIAANGSSNSITYSVDGSSSTTWHFPEVASWTWVDGPVATLSQGMHTLIIKKREANTKLDAFEIKPVALSTGTTLTSSTSTSSTTSTSTATALAATSAFEAEAGALSGGMQILSDSSASGGKYVRAASTGSMTYKISVPTSGTYKVAGWVKADTGSSDSFSLSFDGGSSVTWDLPYPSTSWTYDVDEGHSFSLGAGEHTLMLKYREAGSRVDKLILVKQ